MIPSAEDNTFMQVALGLAAQAAEHGEVPVGAVIVKQGEVIGSGYNRPIADHDPTAHAEIQAIRAACQTLQNYRIPDTTLYVSLEPCAMCAGAIVHARIQRVVFAALEPKAGAVVSTQTFFSGAQLNHQVSVTQGVCADEASAQLRSFFKARRLHKKQLKQEQQNQE